MPLRAQTAWSASRTEAPGGAPDQPPAFSGAPPTTIFPQPTLAPLALVVFHPNGEFKGLGEIAGHVDGH